ncbi:MAG: GGDEF domain-containing protein [Helicobacteraceae bacterium]|jgi:diguanylate cyclase (GGDEF)-like protein|nr:GGDEF domain-containing protein [Helicobacteraceae bacterium]
MKPSISVDAAPSISELFIQEEMRSEKYANSARIFFTLVYLCTGYAIKNEVPETSFLIIIIGASINLLYGIIVYFITGNNRHYRWLKYLSVCVDVFLLSIVIYSIGTFRSFKTEAFLLYFLWIGLATIRFSPKLTLITGLLSLISYFSITLLALGNHTIELGTITDSFISSRVSLTNIIVQMMFLSMFVGIALYISSIYRTLVEKAIDKLLVEKENIELSKTLKTLKSTQKELHNKNRELRYISETDALSQLYNRRKTEELLQTICARAKFHSEPFSLILLDIDLFKKINDEYGHPVGDKVIIQIAANLKVNVRDEDAVGRWGGEEFLVICPSLEVDSAKGLAERLRKDIQFNCGELARTVTCSFGVTKWMKGDTPATIINRVDKALYQSKENGRNCVTLL